MKKILFIFKTIFILELMISFGFAEISTPTPTTALNKIASSMSHSAQNGQQNILEIIKPVKFLCDYGYAELAPNSSRDQGLNINLESSFDGKYDDHYLI